MGKIKICGITNATDAQLASRLGADALGFNLYPESPRFVQAERVRAIVANLPPFVEPVALFVDENVGHIRRTCEFCGIRTVQLQGDEPPTIVSELRAFKILKAIRVASARDLLQLRRYDVDAVLLDACVPGKKGGTGAVFDWSLAKGVTCGSPIILAGGLTPDNVSEAIRKVAPFGVDVCSGVEAEPGRKDRRLLRQFVQQAQRAFADLLS